MIVLIDDDNDRSNSSYVISGVVGGIAGLIVVISLIFAIFSCIKKNCKREPGIVINNNQHQEMLSVPLQMQQLSLPPPYSPPYSPPPYSEHNTITNNNVHQSIVIPSQVNQATVQNPPFVINLGTNPHQQLLRSGEEDLDKD